MRKFLLLMISLTIISGCMNNHFEATNQIHPKILGTHGNEISIEYYLGKLLVLDTIEVPNDAQAIYMRQNPDKFHLQLRISWDDADPLCY